MLLVLAVALVGLGVWAWKPVQRFLLIRQVPVAEAGQRGPGGRPINLYWLMHRLNGQKSGHRYYYSDNGFLALEAWFDGVQEHKTTWNMDGSVRSQRWSHEYSKEARTSPPWRWGVIPQTRPTDPQWRREQGK